MRWEPNPYLAGWDYGLDHPHGRLVDAVRVAEQFSDPGAFLNGRNEGVFAWHENERDLVAAGIEEEAERCRG